MWIDRGWPEALGAEQLGGETRVLVTVQVSGPGKALLRVSGAKAGDGAIHVSVSFRALEPRLWPRAPKLRAPFRRSLTLGTEQPRLGPPPSLPVTNTPKPAPCPVT